jgi:hypothetical protein
LNVACWVEYSVVGREKREREREENQREIREEEGEAMDGRGILEERRGAVRRERILEVTKRMQRVDRIGRVRTKVKSDWMKG